MNRRLFFHDSEHRGLLRSRRPPAPERLQLVELIDPDTISAFERERGVRVRYGTYEGNEEMLAKAITGNSGWMFVSHPQHASPPWPATI